jgi:methionyl-tRNA formyltransferase
MAKKHRLLFLGTPSFAVPVLRALKDSSDFEVIEVVSQPDKPAGRKLLLTASAVKKTALELSIPVSTPVKVSQADELLRIKELAPDLALVVAFGQILSQSFLDLFPLGAFNIHGSLLPKWRGAAPIQRSVEAGESETGLALQKIVKQLDAGDLVGERKVKVGENETALELHDRLALLAPELVLQDLPKFLRGEIKAWSQDATQVTVAKKLDKAESLIEPTLMTAIDLHNKIRAFTMGPGAYFLLAGTRVKVIKSQVFAHEQARVGEIKQFSHQRIGLGCKEGVLELLAVQPESRSAMSAQDWFKGLNQFHVDAKKES